MKNNSKANSSPIPISKFEIMFANIVFISGILFSAILIAFSAYRLYYLDDLIYTQYFYQISLFIAFLSISLFVYGLIRLPPNLKTNFSILFVTLFISIYSFETYLSFKYSPPISYQLIEEEKMRIAERDGIPYDKRSKIELITELNEDGLNIKPRYYPAAVLKENGIPIENGRIFPFGSISNYLTHMGNEPGYYPIVNTDEYGFINSKGLYKKEIDIVLIGDSFTEGADVYENENIGALMRKNDLNVISFGRGGNDSLLEYAIFREYAIPLKPKIVLWLYYDNDIWGIKNEMDSPILKKYFNDDNYSQDLASKQNIIDSALNKFLSSEIKIKIKIESERINDKKIGSNLKNKFFDIIILSNLRGRLQLTASKNHDSFFIFQEIIKKANIATLDLGGKFYFVNLPSHLNYSKGFKDVYRDSIFDLMSELNIPIIDMHNELFATHEDPLSLFPFRLPHHYNAEGYRLVTETILERLKVDGILN